MVKDCISFPNHLMLWREPNNPCPPHRLFKISSVPVEEIMWVESTSCRTTLKQGQEKYIKKFTKVHNLQGSFCFSFKCLSSSYVYSVFIFICPLTSQGLLWGGLSTLDAHQVPRAEWGVAPWKTAFQKLGICALNETAFSMQWKQHLTPVMPQMLCESIMYIHRSWHLCYVIAARDDTKICLQMIF